MTQQTPMIDVARLNLALPDHQLRWLAAQGAGFALPSGRTKDRLSKNWTERPNTLEQAIQHAKAGGNVGLLTGKHSGGIVALDRDVNFPTTVDMLGDLAHTAKIQRDNAPDRGKLLYRVKGAIPKSTVWKEHPKDEHPACELLANGRHALMPPSECNGGRYLLTDAECGILEITLAQLDGIWFVITGQHLDGKAKQRDEEAADSKEDSHQFVQRVKDAWPTLEVFKHWRKDANGTEDEHGETRLLGNGGLLLNDWRWFCHADGCGGDQIDAWHWCEHGKPLDKRDHKAFWNTVNGMAAAAGIAQPGAGHRNGTNGAGYSHGYTDEQPDSADLDTEGIAHRGPGLPSIDPREQLRTVRDAALAAIIAANEREPRHPVLLVRGGQLVRLKTNEDGRTVAEIVTNGALLNILASVADWEKVEEDEDGNVTETPKHPPRNVVTALLNAGAWPGLPVLEGIVYAPTFDRQGRLHSEGGYDAHTRLYNAGIVRLGDTTPTPANVRGALDLVFGDLLVDFPFVDDASRAHALALYLLPFVRRMVDGPTPLHMASAPAAGTGKSLMISLALYAALGELPEPITSSPDPAEMDKTLTAKVIEGPPYLFIDNISGKLDSAALASALTQIRFNRRLLGTNTTISGKVDWVWAGTANNPTVSEELTRRSVLMRLDAGMEQPDRRTGFKHGDITAWAQAHRDELVTAAVTLVRNWQENAAGRRWHERAKGSFEQWAEVMGGILAAAGVSGFLANDDQLREAAAPETADLRAFVAAWAERFAQAPVSVKQLMSIASTVDEAQPALLTSAEPGKAAVNGLDLLGSHLGNGNERSRQTKLGFLLNDHKDRVFGDWRIAEAKRNSDSKSRTWCLLPAAPVDFTERYGTLRNVGGTETANVPVLSTSGEIGFREEKRNVTERLEQFNAREEKTPATSAQAQARARTCEEDRPKRSVTFRKASRKPISPEVDSTGTLRNVGAKEGSTFRNVPVNGGNVPLNGLDAYVGRDLTAPELERAVRAANVAGADFRQLPAGGGLWRLVINPPPPDEDDPTAGL